MSILKQTR